MAIDRQGMGLTILRILLGVFFIFHGVRNVRWLLDPSPLSQQLAVWQHAAPAGSITAHYLQRVAIPYSGVWARAVPLAQIVSGTALLVGFLTPLFALIAFVIVANAHIASGTLATYGFLTNAYGLPVFGGTLALALGGRRLPWSVR